jgi:hypothetical protein
LRLVPQVFNTCLQLFFTVFPQDIAMPMLLLNTLVFGGCLALVFVNGPEHPDLFFFCTVGSALVLGKSRPPCSLCSADGLHPTQGTGGGAQVSAAPEFPARSLASRAGCRRPTFRA